MVKSQKYEKVAGARLYGLALCFLMLVFFSSVKLAMYHSIERDFAGAKVWQQDISNNQSLQVDDQQQAVMPFVALLVLMLSPGFLSRLIPQRRQTPILAQRQWLCPSLFLRPPPVA